MNAYATDHRDEIAYHEAGHGVVMAALNIPFRYISMRPRRTDADAHVFVTGATASKVHRCGYWLADVAGCMAGVIVQDIWNSVNFDDYRSSLAPLRADVRQRLIRHDGRNDMRTARNLTRYAWAREHHTPGWSATSLDVEQSTPRDLAIDAWQLAVWTVARYWSSIEVVSDLLYSSTRAVTWRQVRDTVYAEGPDDDAELEIDHLAPWFLRFSKLQWEPSDAWYVKIRKITDDYRVNEEAA